MPAPQGRYFLATIPHHGFTPFLPPGVSYIKGQLERGDSGYLHWQVLICLPAKKTVAYLRALLGPHHYELSRSSAASEYVWKSASRVGHQFELGSLPYNRNSSVDWNRVWTAATSGELASIPADIRVRHYSTLRKISSDHATAEPLTKEVFVFWGSTGTGKSRRAWNEAGWDAYPKDPRTKWFDGYRGEEHIVIDEFRGSIDIAHLLRWLDRYPVLVEIKGASVPLRAKKIWITSNLDPRQWYPDLDSETLSALLRRLTITHFSSL